MYRLGLILIGIVAVGCSRTGYDDEAAPAGDRDRLPTTCPELPCDSDQWCDAGSCVACDQDRRCGPACEDCTLANLTCGATGCERAGDCADLPDFVRCEVLTASDRDYDICIGDVCVSPGCGDLSCQVSGLSAKLGDSGQATCYDLAGEIPCPGIAGGANCATTPFCGQDAQYGWDPGHPSSTRFVVIEEVADQPVVRDEVNGLMWQGCAAGADGPACVNGGPAGTAWTNAPGLCDALVWGGYDDWYFPDENELSSIVDFGRMDPAIDASIFPRTGGYFWASSVHPDSLGEARKLNFDGSYLSYFDKPTAYQVRCVRLVESQVVLPPIRLIRDLSGAEPVVSDELTDLTWMGCVVGQTGADCTGGESSLSWAEALAACEGSTWAGHDDWYLPNVLELRSIVDPRHTYPAVDEALFPVTPQGATWTSTSDPSDPGYAYVVYFGAGSFDPWTDKTSGLPVRCARRTP